VKESRSTDFPDAPEAWESSSARRQGKVSGKMARVFEKCTLRESAADIEREGSSDLDPAAIEQPRLLAEAHPDRLSTGEGKGPRFLSAGSSK
jgi:hypothetical protein